MMRKSNSPISAQLVIPTSFAECITYEKQILWLKKEIDSLSGGGNPEAISELQRRVTSLETKYNKLQKQLDSLSIDTIENELAVISADIQLIKNSLDTKQDKLTFDAEPTKGSSNPVRSEGILEAIHNEGMRVEQLINGKVDEEVFNEAMRNIINNYVTTGDLTEALTAYAKLTDIAELATKAELADYVKTDALSDLVTNEALNTAIAGLATKTELADKQDTLTFDNTPIEGSDNPITSGAVYEALQNVTPTVNIDDTVTAKSSNAVKSSGIYNFVKSEEENLVTKSDIADMATKTELTDYAKKTDLNTFATKTELEGYVKTEDLDEYAMLTDIADMATKTELTAYAKKTDIADMATKTELTDYAKKTDLNTLATKAELEGYVSDDELATELSNYATMSELSEKQDALTFDYTPTADSLNPVTSDGVKSAIDAIPVVTVDDTVSQSSQNPVSSNGIYNFVLDQMGDLVTTEQLATKQNILTFDDTPTAGSSNPVKSSGIKSAIDAAVTGLVKQEQLSAYATNDSVDGKLTAYATKSDISDMETKTHTKDTYATKTDIADFVTETVMDNKLATKQNTLVFDNTPIENSNNPVTSGGIYEALHASASGMVVKELPSLSKALKDQGSVFLTGTPYNSYTDNDRWDRAFKSISKDDITALIIAGNNKPVKITDNYYMLPAKLVIDYEFEGIASSVLSSTQPFRFTTPDASSYVLNGYSIEMPKLNTYNDNYYHAEYTVSGVSNSKTAPVTSLNGYTVSGVTTWYITNNTSMYLGDNVPVHIRVSITRDILIYNSVDFDLTTLS